MYPVKNTGPTPATGGLKWSSTYSLKILSEKLVSKAIHLPCIIRICTAYQGPDDMMPLYIGDLFLVHGVKKQPRVLLCDVDNRRISIPLSYPAKFGVVSNNGSLGEPRTLEDIVIRPTVPQRTAGRDNFMEGKVVKFMEDNIITYTMGDEMYEPQKFGQMTILDTIEEHYICCCPIKTGSAPVDGCLLLSFLPVDCQMATGMYGCDQATWATILQGYNEELGDLVERAYDLQTCNDVLLLPNTTQEQQAIRQPKFLKASIGRSGKIKPLVSKPTTSTQKKKNFRPPPPIPKDLPHGGPQLKDLMDELKRCLNNSTLSRPVMDEYAGGKRGHGNQQYQGQGQGHGNQQYQGQGQGHGNQRYQGQDNYGSQGQQYGQVNKQRGVNASSQGGLNITGHMRHDPSNVRAHGCQQGSTAAGGAIPKRNIGTGDYEQKSTLTSYKQPWMSDSMVNHQAGSQTPVPVRQAPPPPGQATPFPGHVSSPARHAHPLSGQTPPAPPPLPGSSAPMAAGTPAMPPPPPLRKLSLTGGINTPFPDIKENPNEHQGRAEQADEDDYDDSMQPPSAAIANNPSSSDDDDDDYVKPSEYDPGLTKPRPPKVKQKSAKVTQFTKNKKVARSDTFPQKKPVLNLRGRPGQSGIQSAYLYAESRMVNQQLHNEEKEEDIYQDIDDASMMPDGHRLAVQSQEGESDYDDEYYGEVWSDLRHPRVNKSGSVPTIPVTQKQRGGSNSSLPADETLEAVPGYSAEHFPKDISNYTMYKVSEALHYIKLGQYAAIFQEKQIDGALLMALPKEALMSDVGMKKFDAIKLIKFVGGWRPS